MPEHGGDAGLKEGEVHEADAAEVELLLVLGDDLAEAPDDGLGGGAQGHGALVLRGDGEVVERQAGQVAAVTALLGEAAGQGGEDAVLAGAGHGDAILLVADVAELVEVLGGGGGLLALLPRYDLQQAGDVLHLRGAGREGRLGGGLREWWRGEKEVLR